MLRVPTRQVHVAAVVPHALVPPVADKSGSPPRAGHLGPLSGLVARTIQALH